MKKTWLKMFVIALMTFLISSWSSRDLFATGELPSGEEIIERNIEATGGRKAHENIRNYKVEYTVKIPNPGIEIKMTSYIERPDKAYTITDLGEKGKIKDGSDGKIAWEINPFSGMRLLEGEELAGKLQYYSFDPPDGWKKFYKGVINEGFENVNGKECYKLLFIPKDGSSKTTYYDKETFLIVKEVSEVKTPQGTSQSETYYLEYKEIAKTLTPYKYTSYLNGQLNQDMTIKSIEPNIEIPEETFDFPEEIKMLIKQKEGMKNKKQVLIDIAHNPVFWNNPQNMESKDYNQLERIKYLTQQLIQSTSPFHADIGYIKKQIGSADLDNCDVLFIHVPKAKYNQQEIDAVRQYLDSGGSLFLVMDVDSWSSLEETNVNDIIEPYDIQYSGKSPDSLSGGYTVKKTITEKALKIPYHGGRIIKGGNPFCYSRQTKEYPFGVFKELKTGGKLVVMGDGMPSLYMNNWEDVNDYQCQEFMKEVFKWLLE